MVGRFQLRRHVPHLGVLAEVWRKWADDRVAGDLRLRNMTGGMTIYRVTEDTETHLVVLMKENRGAYSESTMDLASVNPPVIAGMMGHPVSPPEGAENPFPVMRSLPPGCKNMWNAERTGRLFRGRSSSLTRAKSCSSRLGAWRMKPSDSRTQPIRSSALAP